MTHDIDLQNSQKGEIILYQPDETVRLDVRLEDDTVWLTQAQMAELFQKDQSVIARHIGNVFREGELDENSNMQILHNTLSKYKPTKIYSLDVINRINMTHDMKRTIRYTLSLLLLMFVGVCQVWGQIGSWIVAFGNVVWGQEKPVNSKIDGYSGTWLRVIKTEALPSITGAKLNNLVETAK